MTNAEGVEEAVQQAIFFLENLSQTPHKAIYIDGWLGLTASVVLRAIAEDPPLSLLRKFDKIIHVDCSSWKSRRALQRTIAEELKLPHHLMAIFDRQDEEDDFSGIGEGSRYEIGFIGKEILRLLIELRCLVIFHNGSNEMVNLSEFGIPQPEFFDTVVLWTFRGRLRLNSEISKKVDDSHLFLQYECRSFLWNILLQKEAREIAGHTDKLGEVAAECCMYLLSLNSMGGNTGIDYNWATHASSYWVCDGIIQGGQADNAWEVAAALHQLIRIEDYSSNALPSFGAELKTPTKRWIFFNDNSVGQEKTDINSATVHPESTSYFLEVSRGSLRPLPTNMFHQSYKLRVLKLCRCIFSFTSPPFHCCCNLRFLGLDGCKDKQVEQDEKQGILAIELFQSLWVLDICYTDWELALSHDIIYQIAPDIREVHINKGRIWHHGFAWRQLQNLRKLRVTQPTSPWQTGEMDEFTDMVKLEYLSLCGNSTIQVLPSLSGATSLKTLVLDGCDGLEHVGPEGLPPSLESFSLDACTRRDQNKEAKISHISLAGCARLVNFRLSGSLPNLEELNLSNTLIKTLDLEDKVVQAPGFQQIILLGCLELHAILWPREGLPKLAVLCIDSLFCRVQTTLHQAYATIMDLRFLQSMVISNGQFCWESRRFHLNFCVPGSSGKVIVPPPPKSLITKTCCRTYTDVGIDNITDIFYHSNATQFQPSGRHVEISEGIGNYRAERYRAMEPVFLTMHKAKTLHVHDNCSMTSVMHEYMEWPHLKRCRVERCPMLHTVFTPYYHEFCFKELDSFWAADLLTVHCIWSEGRTDATEGTHSFAKLRSICLYSCPRLKFVLPLSWAAPEGLYFRNLETLQIVDCGDLDKVFPIEARILRKIATGHRRGVVEFPKLKHIYLHELYMLQGICEAKMFAPKLETVRIRGCWGLRRLPAVGRDSRPVVDCEKDWWEKLEWDGPEAGHDPSLLRYKKPLPRVSFLR